VRKLDNRYALLFIRGAAPYIHHGTKPPVYTGCPLLRVGGAENPNPSKEEFH